MRRASTTTASTSSAGADTTCGPGLCQHIHGDRRFLPTRNHGDGGGAGECDCRGLDRDGHRCRDPSRRGCGRSTLGGVARRRGTCWAGSRPEQRPRWVWWPHDTPRELVALGLRPARCWDLGAVHRMLVGGWRCSPAAIWASCHGLDESNIPQLAGAPDLFSDHEHHVDADDPLDRSGHLSAEWSDGAWKDTPHGVSRWTSLAAECFSNSNGRSPSWPTLGPLSPRRIPSQRRSSSAPSWSTTVSPSTCPSPKH